MAVHEITVPKKERVVRDYPRCALGDVPSQDEKRPKYPYVLLSEDGRSWDSSTANLDEGLPAFERMVEIGASAGIVFVPENERQVIPVHHQRRAAP